MTSNALHIIPRIAVLGIGCKRGTPADKLADAFAAFCAETKLAPQSIAAAASIDLKKDELGLAEFGQKQGWPLPFIPPTNCAPCRGSLPIQTLCKASPAWITSASAPLCWPQAAPCGRTNGRGTV